MAKKRSPLKSSRNIVIITIATIVLVVLIGVFLMSHSRQTVAGQAVKSKSMVGVSCMEADNGNIPCINATTTLRSREGKLVNRQSDSCVDQNNLREYFCDIPHGQISGERVISTQNIVCQSGCVQGRCVCPPEKNIPVGGPGETTPQEPNNPLAG